MKARPGHFFGELIFAVPAGIALLWSSCEAPAGPDGGDKGDGDPVSTAYIADLVPGVVTDVSALSGKNLHVLLSVMPAAKPESDSGFLPGDPRTIDCGLGSTAASGERSVQTGLPGFPDTPVPSVFALSSTATLLPRSAQIASDSAMRERENALLSLPRVIPVTPSPSDLSGPVFSRAPETIGVGTVWSGVVIEHTGAVINAVCARITDHAVFYVDERDAADPDLSGERLAAIASAFERMYPVCRARFGTESDVDGNGRLIVVFTGELSGGFLGCFNASDKFEFDAETNASSNEGDILYLTTESDSTDAICATLAHEFQHMIHFDEHWRRGAAGTFIWLNEALSQAAEYYCGHQDFHLLRIGLFLSLSDQYEGQALPVPRRELSLTHWSIFNYGYGAVFVRYLIDRYGNDAVKNMCATDKTGIAAVEAATGVDFNVIFAGFLRSLVLSGMTCTAAQEYQFDSLDLRTLQPDGETPLVPESVPYSAGGYAPVLAYPYSIHFYTCAGSFDSMTLTGAEAAGTLFAFDP